jgi:hypothetical protein
VYTLRKGQRSPFMTKAENIGYVNNLYRTSISPWGGTPTSVDPELHGYESGLPAALDSLEQGAPISLSVWLRILVPYVAAIFVRGADFAPRFMSRPSVAAAGGTNTMENANIGRAIELERLLAPACCARWTVLHKSAGEPFVLNDLGVTVTLDIRTGEHGWAIPIGKNSILGIFPRNSGPVSIYDAGGWQAIIGHGLLNSGETTRFNDFTARGAISFVIGSEPAAVERLAPVLGDQGNVSAIMDSWPFDHRTRLAHAREWHRLMTVAIRNTPPDDLVDLQYVDWKALAMDWYPPAGVILNMREFPSGLTRVGNVIGLNLDMPVNYEEYLTSSRPR